jgi:macrolide transport system ATP-binding/permease protein
MDDTPLIELDGIGRSFPGGDQPVRVLTDVTLSIGRGEMVAIIGPSGSGKSTLMNILGCLDRPTTGEYRVGGRATATLQPDELAELRREHFGFVFQRYHLLAELTALGNVEIPAIYAGTASARRRQRATALLTRLGMSERLQHRPGQLSGGQQQRVSIARALMNGAEVLLADEPTGALDSRTGEEMLKILEELNAEGTTIIVVTHDMAVARRARRIIEIADGCIVSDTLNPDVPAPAPRPRLPAPAIGGWSPLRSLRMAAGRFREALRMAWLAMNAHRLRTFLTMLGIIIGIASVVSIVALGTGSQQLVLANISQLGTNTLEIFPGKDFGDVRSGAVRTLVLSDADALGRQPFAAGVTPTVSKSETLRAGSVEATSVVSGVGVEFFSVRNMTLNEGRLFDRADVASMAQDVVIDTNSRKTLFPDIGGVRQEALGRVIFIGKVPARVIGVVQTQQGGFGGSGSLNVYLPYTTVQARLTGDATLRSVMLRIDDGTDTTLAEEAATDVLLQRHKTKDFFILNTDDIRQTITSTTQTLTLLVAAIAVISLIVGGIGVMNIMLVSVSERVQEIGVRMAVGARRGDILQQFLTEAVLVCFAGGLIGVATALAIGLGFGQLSTSLRFIFSVPSIIWAFCVSTAIGVAFGFLPARSASRLDPVAALTRG